MTTGRDPNAWRTHEVPTFTEAEDTWILGLTLKQLIMLGIVAALSYAVFRFSPLWFLPLLLRIAFALTFALVGSAMVVIKPGGRSMFSVIGETFSFMLAPKEYLEMMDDLVSSQTVQEREEIMEAYRVSQGVVEKKPTGVRAIMPACVSGVKALVMKIRGGGEKDDVTGGALVAVLLISGWLMLGACGGRAEAQSPVSDHYSC